MADHNVIPEHRADEIAALKRQMEEMSKRLEELSATDALPQDSSADDSASGAKEISEASIKAEEGAARPSSSLDYEPYTPPVEATSRSGDAAATASNTAVPPSVNAQQSDGASKQSTSQTSGEAHTNCTQVPYNQTQAGTYGQQQSSPEAAQQAAQPQDPYGGTYAGQQVPFGQPGQQYYYQQAQQPYYGYGYGAQQGGAYQPSVVRTKDHVAAGLLGIFLGGLGIHKFYLGYNTSGFIMLGVCIVGGLFTLGLAAVVMWLIGLIEGVLYLVKDQTEFEQTYVLKKREWF